MISFTHAEIEKIVRDSEDHATKQTLSNPVDPYVDEACLSGVRYMRRLILINLNAASELMLTNYLLDRAKSQHAESNT